MLAEPMPGIFGASTDLEFEFEDLDESICSSGPSFLDIPIGTPEDLPPPDPNLTVAEAVAWMKEEIEKTGHLQHDHAVRHIYGHFGERFRVHNNRGNRILAPEVIGCSAN